MTQDSSTIEQLFAGDGEIARLIRSHDWSETQLGAVETWSDSLKTAVQILLTELDQPKPPEARLLNSGSPGAAIGQTADGTTQDITDRQQSESQLRVEDMRRAAEAELAALNQLRQSEGKYRSLFTSIDEGFCTIEVLFDANEKPFDYRFLEVNPAFERQTGLENVIGRTMREFVPQHEEFWFEIYGCIALTGVAQRFEHRATALGRFYDVYAFRIGDAAARQVAILFNDISARKQAEVALRSSEEQLRLFVTASSDIVYKMSADWSEMRYLKGKDFLTSTENASGTWLEQYIPLEDQPEVMVAIQAAIRTKSTFELEHRVIQLDGTVGWTFSRAIPLLNAQDEIVEWLGAASDITDRKQAEAQLRRGAKLDAFRVTLNDALRSLSDPEEIKYQAVCVLGKHLGSDRAYYFEIDEPHAEFVVARDWHQPGTPSHARRYPLEGWPMPWLVDGQPWVVRDVDTDPAMPDDQRASYRGNDIGALIVVPLIKGIRLVASVATNQHTPRDWIPDEITFVEETAERTWAAVERAHAEAALRESEEQYRTLNQQLEQRVQERTTQLEALNQELEAFSGSVSHDLKTPLNYITITAERLWQKLDSTQLDATSRRYLNIIAQSARQAGAMVDDLLEFSRMGQAQMRQTTVEMNTLVQQVQQQLQPEMTGRVIRWQVAALPTVQGDLAMLRLVWQNLLANAVKYTRDRPETIITVGSRNYEHETVFFVQDNGAGFDMQYHDRLFRIFQRLHSQQQFAGTGVGLANVRRIIHRHGGRTWAEGALDRGATFYFSLPKQEKQK
ncbi:MAG: ATP-binding protein [Nostoc sp.]|uniref:ATP-binding protein n=1 Tax=Nostoc sp. TaxID=1180 RepID=UPI002FF169C6